MEGSDVNNKKPPKAAWSMVNIPKEKGGLGVLNLSIQNESLMLKHLHKFYNKVPVPWVSLVWEKYYSNGKLPRLTASFRGSFWWKDLLKLLDPYKGMAMANVSDGLSCFFWLDQWDSQVMHQTFPELFSFSKDAFISVKKIKTTTSLVTHFHLPLSTKAYGQFQQLQDRCKLFSLCHSQINGVTFGAIIYLLRRKHTNP